MKQVYEIAIMTRATWNLHSLNNEGTVGNVTEPRTVVLANGTRTDGISGEMLKHIHAENMWVLEENKGNFCEACRKLEPARADRSSDVRKQKSPSSAAKQAIADCAICDVHGFLVQRPTVARPSTVEFGWAVGIGDSSHREIHLHARHALGEKGKAQEGKCDECGKEKDVYKVGERLLCEDCAPSAVTSQMIYHRPTRSGIYAVISVFQPWRIGLNNVDFDYEIANDVRKARYSLALRAYQALFGKVDGAMTTTRLPHIEGFEGIVVVSPSNFPVPIMSPLNDNYIDQIQRLAKVNNTMEVYEFKDMAGFAGILEDLSKRDIFTLETEKQKKG